MANHASRPRRIAVFPGQFDPITNGHLDVIRGGVALFDLDVSDYDMLYRSKLDLLLALNGQDRVTWSGPHRHRPLNDRLVVPQPEEPPGARSAFAKPRRSVLEHLAGPLERRSRVVTSKVDDERVRVVDPRQVRHRGDLGREWDELHRRLDRLSIRSINLLHQTS